MKSNLISFGILQVLSYTQPAKRSMHDVSPVHTCRTYPVRLVRTRL